VTAKKNANWKQFGDFKKLPEESQSSGRGIDRDGHSGCEMGGLIQQK
jgi:hypothetical protein